MVWLNATDHRIRGAGEMSPGNVFELDLTKFVSECYIL